MHLGVGQQPVMFYAHDHQQRRRRRSALVFSSPARHRSTFHLPTEPIFLLFGVDTSWTWDAPPSMSSEIVLASVVIARWEGEFPASSASSLSAPE